ncbi:MAG TPA: GNAT family N-acetyltransferase, partial [Caldimonas sp.]|nr:GNAT family N-acetyltransferase [Caldimonas sp.]
MIGFDVILKDGRVAHLRPSGPADEAEFLQAFERMGSDARYMRFMRVVREPDRARLREVLASFPEGGVGIVATVPAADGIDIVGSAVAVFAAVRVRCEFAITVAAAYGGSGL